MWIFELGIITTFVTRIHLMPMKGLRRLTLVPILMLLASITLGVSHYHDAKESMRQDLTHALRQYVLHSSQSQLLPDSPTLLRQGGVFTLNDAESHFSECLTIPSLKDTSHVSLCLLQQNGEEAFLEEALLCSDTLLWSASSDNKDVVAFKAYANPTFCSVLGHSDQKVPLTGIIFCSLLLSVMAWRNKMPRVEEMTPVVDVVPQAEMHLTPMQEQLMEMFHAAPGHTLSKEAICAALWPKKDHPETTLYTFICRLKSTLKEQSDMDIINKRGKEYQLRKNSTTD